MCLAAVHIGRRSVTSWRWSPEWWSRMWTPASHVKTCCVGVMHKGSVHLYSQNPALVKLQYVDVLNAGWLQHLKVNLTVISADAALHQDNTHAWHTMSGGAMIVEKRKCFLFYFYSFLFFSFQGGAMQSFRQLSLHANMPHDCHAQSWDLVFMLSVHVKCIMSVSCKAATRAKPFSLRSGARSATCIRAIQADYWEMHYQDTQWTELARTSSLQEGALTHTCTVIEARSLSSQQGAQFTARKVVTQATRCISIELLLL